jgi:hypothetical protein
MNTKSTIVKHSPREVRARRARGEDKTRPDAPEAESLSEDFWRSAQVVMRAHVDAHRGSPEA